MVKQSSTYEQQIAKLREHGCTVSDGAFCDEVLSRVSYYRLSAYFLTFKMEDGLYASGTDFNKVFRIYEFDCNLRRLLFSVLEELEIYIRAQLSYYHTQKYGVVYIGAFSVIPANIPAVDKSAERKLFASIMALRGLYPNEDKWNNELIIAMSALFDEYSDAILLKHIGFPEDWETIMRK